MAHIFLLIHFFCFDTNCLWHAAAAVLGVDDGLYTLRPPELTAINHFKDVSLEQTAAVVAAAAAAAAAAINNDDIAADGFQELSLENGGDDSALDGDLDGPATPREQNIYKVARNNKAKMGKALRHESTKMMATANAMLSAEAFASGSNGSIFNHITNLYDQFQWGMSDIGKSVTRKCANDMATYLRALDKGQTWALQGMCADHIVMCMYMLCITILLLHIFLLFCCCCCCSQRLIGPISRSILIWQR